MWAKNPSDLRTYPIISVFDQIFTPITSPGDSLVGVW
jgi:hypothetical protein